MARRTPQPPRRSNRRLQLFVTLGAAVVIALALVGASRLSADSNSQASSSISSSSQGGVKGAVAVGQLLAGIPQNGEALGKPNAPVTLVEYGDLQCPFCDQWALNTLPTLVRDYVRAGKLRIEFRGLAFIGQDSVTALQTALAAGQQDRLWNVVELFYANQGAENSGWVTQDLLSKIVASVPGLDAQKLASDRSSPAIDTEMAQIASEAQAAGVNQTPFFQLGRTGGPLHRLQVTSLDPPQFQSAIEAQLAK